MNSVYLEFIDVWTPIWSCTILQECLRHSCIVHDQIGVHTSMNTKQTEFNLKMFAILFTGYLYDHFNKLLLIFFSVLVIASSTAALPWCSHFPLMIAMRVFTGIGAGGLDTGKDWEHNLKKGSHFCVWAREIQSRSAVKSQNLPAKQHSTQQSPALGNVYKRIIQRL